MWLYSSIFVIYCLLLLCGSLGADTCREKLKNGIFSITQDKFKEVHYWRTNNNASIAEKSPSLCTKETEKWHFFSYGGANPSTKDARRHRGADDIVSNASKLSYIDHAHSFHPANIDAAFAEKHKGLLQNPRCFPFLSKVYFLHRLIVEDTSIADGDIVIFIDSDIKIVNENGVRLLACLAKNSEKGIAPFHFSYWLEEVFTKRDTLLALGMDGQDTLETVQMQGGCFAFVKNQFTRQFVSEWFHYVKMPEHLTLSKSIAKNHPDFWTHKEDQSILSLLVKKYNVKSYPLPFVNAAIRSDILAIEAGYTDDSVEMAYWLDDWSPAQAEHSRIEREYHHALKKPRVQLSPRHKELLLHRRKSFLEKECDLL